MQQQTACTDTPSMQIRQAELRAAHAQVLGGMRVAAAPTDIHVGWRAMNASVLKGSCFDRSCGSVSVAYKFIVIGVSRRRWSMHVVRDVHEGVHSYTTCAPPQPLHSVSS